MLDDTATGGRAGIRQVRWNGNAEAGFVGRNGYRGASIDIPRDQWLANDLVGRGVDDGNVCNTSVWCADVEGHVDDLAGCVRLNFVRVVGVLEAFAEPDLTLVGIVVGLRGGNLELALDVAVVVRLLVVVYLGSTSGLHCSTGHSRSRGGEEAVG